ncbi:hypothetical protein BDC45DRAFT_540178 [Circinella umbellata]|nr:hypothetical protein BDC45DRAFT_540178 [Circinella umbellata]
MTTYNQRRSPKKKKKCEYHIMINIQNCLCIMVYEFMQTDKEKVGQKEKQDITLPRIGYRYIEYRYSEGRQYKYHLLCHITKPLSLTDSAPINMVHRSASKVIMQVISLYKRVFTIVDIAILSSNDALLWKRHKKRFSQCLKSSFPIFLVSLFRHKSHS